MSHTVKLKGSQWTHKLGISLKKLYKGVKRQKVFMYMYIKCVCTKISTEKCLIVQAYGLVSLAFWTKLGLNEGF